MIPAPDSVRTNYNRINKSPDTTLGGCGAELRLTLCRLGPIYGQVLLGPAPQLPRVFCVYGIGAQPPTGASVPFILLKAPLGGPGRLRIKKGCRCSVSGDGVAYPQNRHQGRTGAALRAVWANSRCNWSISPARMVSCSSRLFTRAFNSATRAASSASSMGGASSEMFTIHRNPPAYGSLMPETSPVFSLRRRLAWAMPRCRLACSIFSFIIPSRLSHRLTQAMPVVYPRLAYFVAYRVLA